MTTTKKIVIGATSVVFLTAIASSSANSRTVPEPVVIPVTSEIKENNFNLPLQEEPKPVQKQQPQAEKQNCHPSYSGCLNPNASDYDCAGGSGNGPYYTGPVQVVGPDVFGLDRDHDGWGCE